MRNWKKVNGKYINEGYLFLSFGFLKTWNEELTLLNKDKEGARYIYPESLIRFCSVLKACFHLGFRQEQGFLQALQKWVPLQSVPSYSQIERRMVKLGLNLVESLEQPKDAQIVAIDSTGIKLYNSGQWIREKHKKKGPFLKLHIAVNVKGKQAVALKVTEDCVGDSKLGLSLIDQARKVKKISTALLDGAYDTYRIWNGLHARGIRPLIRLRANAVVNYKKSETRSRAVKSYKGVDEFAKVTGFGQRWQVETWFSSYKRRFGEHCSSIKPENVLHEILLKACLCNQLIRG
jgi:hypothetical protein